MLLTKTSTIAVVAVCAAIIACSGAAGDETMKTGRAEPSPAETIFQSLPLGQIRPRGWLEQQLRIQADGLTGTLPTFWPDIGPNSGWLGGNEECFESGPYYTDGLVPLAFLLGDEDIIKNAHKWVGWTLDNLRKDGRLGPERYTGLWPSIIMLKVLTQYHEATGDKRVIPAMENCFKYLEHEVTDKGMRDWGHMRWQDAVVSALWLYRRNGDPKLLELARQLQKRGYDWPGHFDEFRFTSKTKHFGMQPHGVNNAMGVKTAAVMYEATGDDRYREAALRGLKVLDTHHGQATGVFSCDEQLAGRNPSQGTELCAVVELMFSLEQMVRILGDPILGDKLERIAFNALPAPFSPDMCARQYDQQANQIVCKVSLDRVYTNNGPHANLYSIQGHYGCCTANLHQGWPKFATHLWMATPNGGIAAISYAPCRVRTPVADGVTATVGVETDYPFDETVTIKIALDRSAEFPLMLRIPGWTEGARIKVNGKSRPAKAGTFVTLNRKWNSGDVVELQLPMPIRIERRFNDSVCITRGPLVYSLKIGEQWKKIRGEHPNADYEVHPTTPWNYGLMLDTERPEKSVKFVRKNLGNMIFSSDGAPVELHLRGKLVPEWKLEHNAAGTLPKSPVRSDQPVTDLVLIPYGCAKLRVTEFPLLEK